MNLTKVYENAILEAKNIIDAQKEEIERLKEDYAKEKYLVDKYTRQLTDEYKNTEYQCKEKERLNNIIEDFEEELEREVNIKEENTGLEHNTYIDINSTLKSVLKRFRELKGSDKK